MSSASSLCLLLLAHSCIIDVSNALLSDLPPIPDASGFVEVYRRAVLRTLGEVSPITSDISIPLSENVPLSRVAYFLHLNDNWAFASFDAADLLNNVTGAAPTLSQLASLPFANTSAPAPHLMLHQSVRRLNVASNLGALNDSLSSGGALEIWTQCYGGTVFFGRPGATGFYDNDDTPGGNRSDNCYGSFQVHNGAEVVLSYCGFTNGPTSSTSGTIGNHPGNNSDATHAGNIRGFTRRSLQIFVLPSTTPTPPTPRPTPFPTPSPAPTPSPTPQRTTTSTTATVASTVSSFVVTTMAPTTTTTTTTTTSSSSSETCMCPICPPTATSPPTTTSMELSLSATTASSTPLLTNPTPSSSVDPVIAGVIGGVIGIVATVLCGGLVLFAMRKRSSTVNHNRSIPMTMTGTSPSPQPQSQRDIYGAATGTLATGSAIDDYQSVGSSSNASYARLPMRDVQANYASGDIEILR